MPDIPEHRLPGGFVADVVRVGDTVRRAAPPGADSVHRLLRHFRARGWSGAPDYLGMDARGREILSFVDGEVPWRPGPPPYWVRSADNLARVAALVRAFHDLTAGTPLAGDAEVVCHNDLSPKNTVYRDTGAGQRPVAFVDWDIAAPGQRVHDVAHVCWQYIGLGPSIVDPGAAAHLVTVVADGYGLGQPDRAGLVDTILWWQDRCWRGIETAARAAEPAMVRLRELGAVRTVRAAYEWTADHRAILGQALV